MASSLSGVGEYVISAIETATFDISEFKKHARKPKGNCAEKKNKLRRSTGSRNLVGCNNEDLDFYCHLGNFEDLLDNEFISNERRFNRATAIFEEDLADLRRKRREKQDRMFDMIDLNAEIEKAKNTLGAADNIFQRHALRFDNENGDIEQNMSLIQRLERARKVAAQEIPDPKRTSIKWSKLVPIDQEMASLPLEVCEIYQKPKINSVTYNPCIDNEVNGKHGYSEKKIVLFYKQ